MSLSDLARKYNCTRQYIHKLLKLHGIPRRDKGGARTLALNQGKLSFTRVDKMGLVSKVLLQKININRNFFKSWYPAMAYVLGVIYTDGSLIPGSRRDSKYKSRTSRFSVVQKEPELLQKVLALMDCNAKLYRSKQRLTGNPVYNFHVNDEEVYDDLLKLGLKPKKSLTLEFPDMPGECLRHFIRGCWDGDGSIYLEQDRVPCANFISGSRKFIEKMMSHLVTSGLPPRTIYVNTDGGAYYFKFRGDAVCSQLYHFLYDDVPESMYLARKHERFRQYARDWEGERVLKGQPHLAIPEPFTRTTLSHLLKISSKEVSRIMESKDLVAGVQKLAQITAPSSKEFRDSVRELRSKVNMFLHGWGDEE